MEEITRFDLDMDGSMDAFEDGRWVRYDDVEAKIAAIKAERDALRADAERYRWARQPENASAVYHMIDRGECGANMDARIDDARAQS